MPWKFQTKVCVFFNVSENTKCEKMLYNTRGSPVSFNQTNTFFSFADNHAIHGCSGGWLIQWNSIIIWFVFSGIFRIKVQDIFSKRLK